jgi:hypothetical protein
MVFFKFLATPLAEVSVENEIRILPAIHPWHFPPTPTVFEGMGH